MFSMPKLRKLRPDYILITEFIPQPLSTFHSSVLKSTGQESQKLFIFKAGSDDFNAKTEKHRPGIPSHHAGNSVSHHAAE